MYRGQFEQDRLLDALLFREMRGGVFVDIGAHDGLTLSNTAVFELERGWTGVCIEPNPAVFAALAANRPAATCLNLAIGCGDGLLPFVQVNGYSEMLSALAKGMSNAHRRRIEREVGKYGGSIETVEVPIRHGRDLLPAEVHYLSIDTEGSEIDVLRSIDFDRTMVHAITTEQNDAASGNVLAAVGDDFDLVGLHHVDLFLVNRRSPFAANIPALRDALEQPPAPPKRRGIGGFVRRLLRDH